LTCASSVAAVALVVLELFPFAFDQVAVQARTRRLLPVIELVTGRTVLAGRRIAFRRRCVDQVDCHVRHHVRLHDLLCLHVVICFEGHLPSQVFPMVSRPFGWMVEFG
jgi:hypothetical protein